MKIPRKCHNHKAQPSRVTKRRRDEQIRTPRTPHTYEITDVQTKRISTEEPPGNGQLESCCGLRLGWGLVCVCVGGGGGGAVRGLAGLLKLDIVLLVRNLTLNSEALFGLKNQKKKKKKKTHTKKTTKNNIYVIVSI